MDRVAEAVGTYSFESPEKFSESRGPDDNDRTDHSRKYRSGSFARPGALELSGYAARKSRFAEKKTRPDPQKGIGDSGFFAWRRMGFRFTANGY